jgi:hypothetical protein
VTDKGLIPFCDKQRILFGAKHIGYIDVANTPFRTSIHACRACGSLVTADDMNKHVVFHESLGFVFLDPDGRS